jgi:hypothetical protein
MNDFYHFSVVKSMLKIKFKLFSIFYSSGGFNLNNNNVNGFPGGFGGSINNNNIGGGGGFSINNNNVG